MYDLTVAGKPSDVCDVLHASRRDTYICMYERAYVPAADHACAPLRAISENSLLLYVRFDTGFIRRRDRIIIFHN